MSTLNVNQLAGGSIEHKFKKDSKIQVVKPKTNEPIVSLTDKIRKLETESIAFKIELSECKIEIRTLRNEIQSLRSEKEKVGETSITASTCATATADSTSSPSPNILQYFTQSAPNRLNTEKTKSKEKRRQEFKRSKTYIQDYFPDNCILEEVIHCEKDKRPSKMRLTYNKTKNHFLDLDDGTIYLRLCHATKDHISKSGIHKKNVPSAYSSFKMIQGNKRHSIERLDISPIVV